MQNSKNFNKPLIKEFERLKLKQKFFIKSLDEEKNIKYQNLLIDIQTKLDFLTKIFTDVKLDSSNEKKDLKIILKETILKSENKIKEFNETINFNFKNFKNNLSNLENNISNFQYSLKDKNVLTNLSNNNKKNYDDKNENNNNNNNQIKKENKLNKKTQENQNKNTKQEIKNQEKKKEEQEIQIKKENIKTKLKSSLESLNTEDKTKELKKQVLSLSPKIEKLEAKNQAGFELAKLSEDKFRRINEQIGELKNSVELFILEKKKLEEMIFHCNSNANKIDTKIIYEKISLFKKKLEKFSQKLTLLDKNLENYKETFSKFKNKLKVFEQKDEILKLENQVSKQLKDVKKLVDKSNKETLKIENHILNINSKISDVNFFIEQIKEDKTELTILKEDLLKTKEIFDNLDIENFNEKFEKTQKKNSDLIELLETYINDLETENKQISQRINKLENSKNKT